MINQEGDFQEWRLVFDEDVKAACENGEKKESNKKKGSKLS